MNFGEINNIIFIGGSEILPDLCNYAIELGFSVEVVSGERLLCEVIGSVTLKEHLNLNKINYYSIDDINQWVKIGEIATSNTFAISIGSPWIFDKNIIDEFETRMANIQPVGIPLFDGGAHFSWQILMGNKEGTTLVQMIDEKLNTGQVVLTDVYAFPSSARTPLDYFEASRESRLNIGKMFLEMLSKQADFKPYNNEARFRTFYPRLYTMEHGYINWQWRGEAIEQFICAFDEPYAGASTFIDGVRVWLKDVTFDRGSSTFHPFMSGIVYKKTEDYLSVTVSGGTIIVRNILDASGNSYLHKVKIGKRFYTPIEVLEEAMLYNAVYSAKGIEVKEQ